MKSIIILLVKYKNSDAVRVLRTVFYVIGNSFPITYLLHITDLVIRWLPAVYNLTRERKKEMFQRWYPKMYVDSTYEVDFDYFYRIGFRGIIFDIDNTMVPHGAPADERSKELFRKLKQVGFQTCALSNNKEPRVKMFCDEVDSKYIFQGGKPNTKGYRQAMEILGTDEKTTLFIGDQIFTDIWGANRTGIFSILVKPIHPKEEIQIVLKRKLEKIVLWAYAISLKRSK